jgi:hypothetical protein
VASVAAALLTEPCATQHTSCSITRQQHKPVHKNFTGEGAAAPSELQRPVQQQQGHKHRAAAAVAAAAVRLVLLLERGRTPAAAVLQALLLGQAGSILAAAAAAAERSLHRHQQQRIRPLLPRHLRCWHHSLAPLLPELPAVVLWPGLLQWLAALLLSSLTALLLLLAAAAADAWGPLRWSQLAGSGTLASE